MIEETSHLTYVIDEYTTLIKETKDQIRVVMINYRSDLETALEIVNDLENKIRSLQHNIPKPYFARIDFLGDNHNNKDICYIGKIGVINNDNKIVTVDWRAPIASLYYDSNIGHCRYLAPLGLIEGNLTLKRQYDIEQGILKSFNDVDTVVDDELLKPYLNANANDRLKNIIATIQSEQNNIIRKKLEQNIIVQGVAGSGKTTVALHRIAYLVYNNRDNIDVNQYMVIGPNKFFINYISSVLPDLDVNGVKQYDFIELAHDFLGENFEIIDSVDNEITTYKTTLTYRDIIDKYVEDLEEVIIPNNDLKIFGFTILTSLHIRNIYNSVTSNYSDLKSKVKKCILIIEKEIGNNQQKYILRANLYIDTLFNNEQDIKLKNEYKKERELIKREIQSNCQNILNKYFRVVNDRIMKLYIDLLDNIDKYETDTSIVNHLKEDSKYIRNRKVKYEDLIALMYLKYKIRGNSQYDEYRHIVIDEAQDYNEFVFYTFKCLFKNTTFSIFGDLAQSIYPYRSISDWQILSTFMNLEYIPLNKSYRTSIEIMNEANKINKYLGLNEAIPVIRHGNIPLYINSIDNDYILNKVLELKEKGYMTIAVISKTNEYSNRIYDYLKNKIEVTNINSLDLEYKGGICTITSSLVKGLEFDAVIITNASEEVFNSNNPNDMKLLYVSMTRPLHELIIMYDNNITKPIKNN